MPIKTTAWACQWKCRRRVLTDKRKIEKHERLCFRNPARRACITCEHFSSEDDEFYSSRDCEWLYELVEEKLQHDCPLWAEMKGG